MKPLFLLLLGLTLLVPATHAQDDDAQYDEYTDYGDEYADEITLSRAFEGRQRIHTPSAADASPNPDASPNAGPLDPH